jgi:hypothetical protein
MTAPTITATVVPAASALFLATLTTVSNDCQKM